MPIFVPFFVSDRVLFDGAFSLWVSLNELLISFKNKLENKEKSLSSRYNFTEKQPKKGKFSS